MSDQSVRQTARRNARDAQRRLVAAREQREKRLSKLGVQVVVALVERDAKVAEQERVVGVALRSMTETEGLALRDAVKWCGDGVSVREASRMRQLDAPGVGPAKVDVLKPAPNPDLAEAVPAEAATGQDRQLVRGSSPR